MLISASGPVTELQPLDLRLFHLRQLAPLCRSAAEHPNWAPSDRVADSRGWADSCGARSRRVPPTSFNDERRTTNDDDDVWATLLMTSNSTMQKENWHNKQKRVCFAPICNPPRICKSQFDSTVQCKDDEATVTAIRETILLYRCKMLSKGQQDQHANNEQVQRHQESPTPKLGKPGQARSNSSSCKVEVRGKNVPRADYSGLHLSWGPA